MWICVDCGGRSATWATLDKALSTLTYKRLLTAFKSAKIPSHRECPECHKKMRRISLEILGREHYIEMCEQSHLAWFDHREFEHLPFAVGAEEELRLPPHVQEALNEIQIHHGRVVSNRSTFRLDARDFGFGWDKNDEKPSGWKFALGLLLIPVERENRVGMKPWATWSLLAIVTIISIFGFWLPDLALELAVQNDNLFRWGGLTLFAYFFFHGGWFHLLGNMYYLWLFGDNVEDELGPWGFLATTLAGSAGGALLHCLFDPAAQSYLVGASAGISTLGMIYMLRFPRAKLAIFLIFRWLRVPAYIFAIIWIVMQVDLAYDQIGGLTRVSALAHLGGAIVGVLVYYFALRPSVRNL